MLESSCQLLDRRNCTLERRIEIIQIRLMRRRCRPFGTDWGQRLDRLFGRRRQLSYRFTGRGWSRTTRLLPVAGYQVRYILCTPALYNVFVRGLQVRRLLLDPRVHFRLQRIVVADSRLDTTKPCLAHQLLYRLLQRRHRLNHLIEDVLRQALILHAPLHLLGARYIRPVVLVGLEKILLLRRKRVYVFRRFRWLLSRLLSISFAGQIRQTRKNILGNLIGFRRLGRRLISRLAYRNSIGGFLNRLGELWFRRCFGRRLWLILGNRLALERRVVANDQFVKSLIEKIKLRIAHFTPLYLACCSSKLGCTMACMMYLSKTTSAAYPSCCSFVHLTRLSSASDSSRCNHVTTAFISS